jgi:tetratricopeptide (TPR) repeat protein
MNLIDGKREVWNYFNEGSIDKAYKTAESLSANYSNDEEIKYLLGCCLGRLGRYSEAAQVLKSGLEISPENSQILVALGRALRANDKTDEAIKYFQAAFELEPLIADTHIALGDAHLSKRNYDKAHYHFSESSKLAPDRALPHFNLGLLARHLNPDVEVTLSHFLKAIELSSTVPEYLNAAGECFEQLEQHSEAIIKFSLAIDANKNYLQARTNLIKVYITVGEYHKAEKLINYLLERKKLMYSVAMSFLLICKHLGRCEDAIDYATSCLDDSSLDNAEKVNIYRQMAIVLDHLQRYDEAWRYITKSKYDKYVDKSYDPIVHKKVIDILIETFSPAVLLNLPDSGVDNSERPIFIVGMPRSGTSLTEQIFASHPEVAAGGELIYISEFIDNFPNRVKTTKQWPECIRDVLQNDLAEMAEDYLKKIQGINSQAKYVTDKMPHNFYALGLIQMLFPKAKVIHCRRNELDTCISIYFQSFLVGHDYSKNLFNLGAHYHQYQRLMHHWQQHLSLKIFDLEYENLIHSPRQVISDMLEFCELDWDENCMNFHTHERIVSTASFDQVRQPLHNKSVSRWKNYETYLSEIKKGLQRGF